MVVYLDVLFAVNALMDGATLLAAARLGGVQVQKMRMILSSALGGGYAVLGAVWPVLTLAPLRLLAGLGLCAAAFGGERCFARLCALYGVVSASFAGLAAALSAASGRRLLLSCGYYFAVPIQVLVLAAAVGYAASGILLRGDAKHGALHRETETLTIRFGNRQTAVRVLHDTGNTLRSPVTGQPVLVLEQTSLGGLLPPEVERIVTRRAPPEERMAQLHATDLGRRFSLLPFCSIGAPEGLLLAVCSDSVQIGGTTYPRTLVALSPGPVSDGGGYQALWGGTERGKHEKAVQAAAGVAAQSAQAG